MVNVLVQASVDTVSTHEQGARGCKLRQPPLLLAGSAGIRRIHPEKAKARAESDAAAAAKKQASEKKPLATARRKASLKKGRGLDDD